MGTFINGVNCDIYIGKGAGKKLLDDIKNAKHSIKITSPYLSPSLVKHLIELNSEKKNIHLITTDTIEDYENSYRKNIHELIKQHQIKDEAAEKIRNKWIDSTKFILFGIIGFSLTLLLTTYFYRELKLLYGIIPIILAILVFKFYQNKIKQKRIYNYHYSQLFPFKVFISPRNNNAYKNRFIHGKIYIIDDEIVYMGSLNFTKSGTEDNYETRIRTTDPAAITTILNEFNNLFHHSGLPERDIQQWGKILYTETIN
ncbi:phospholipase D-like domain-containing protein [Flavobacterium terrigena]|uniref:phospholipase D n=1 Tax=Flavobacterium terrigena TaxID=402734 RepID=A0A1H6S9T1_9FLAO|nr:phospholipase D family protein [Flavobacterium terrigena]SEI63566.1 PLD-like domain-containing protein [Flavobacterium terrigena]